MYFCSIPSLSLPIFITSVRSCALILENSSISSSVRIPMCTRAGRSSVTPKACNWVRSSVGAAVMSTDGCFLQGTCSTVTTVCGSRASECSEQARTGPSVNISASSYHTCRHYSACGKRTESKMLTKTSLNASCSLWISYCGIVQPSISWRKPKYNLIGQ